MKRLVLSAVIVSSFVFSASAVTQPDAISNLVFWVKADAGVTTNASGHVLEWADQSARGNLATNVAASAPLHVASEPGLNNRPTLRFNGSSQRLLVANRMLTNGIEGCTLIAMAKADRNDNVAIIGIRTGGGNPLMQLDQDAAGKLRFIVRNAAATPVVANALSSQIHTGTFGMYAGRLFKGTDTVWTNRVYFSNARTAEASVSANFGASTDLTSGTQYIGGLGTPSYWQGDIAEIIIYERALSEAELVAMEEYLASRYKVGRSAQTSDLIEDIPGLKLWLRADACAYEDLFANDDAEHLDVARLWSDATTNDHDAVAITSPTLVTNMVNGLPALGFSMNAADRYYLDNPITTDPRQLVVFAVFRQMPDDVAQNMIFTHRYWSNPLIQASFKDATNAILQIRGGSAVGGVQMITAPGLLTNGTFNVVMYQFDAVNDRHAVAVNGAAEVVNTYDFGAQTFLADTQRIGCYNYQGGETLFLHGFLAELLVYEGTALTRKQKSAVGYYLETKYGLDTGYAPSGTLLQIH
jgi:hypothetical protein